MRIKNIDKKLPIYNFRLDNGMKAVLVHKKTSPIVSFNLSYRVGSKDEKPGKTGFAHLFEHMMFEGTANVPKGEFDRLCSLSGGSNNAYTTYDWTSYVMTLPSSKAELGFWLESDRMKNFKLLEEAFKNQQSVVSEEILQTVKNQPYGRWREVQAEHAFEKETGYSWEVQGTIEDVRGAGTEDALNFYNKFYHPGNACLTVCGELGTTEFDKFLHNYFDDIPALDKPQRNDFSKNFRRYGCHGVLEDNVPLPAVFVSYHTNGFFDDDTMYPGDIISAIASYGNSSRLHSKLVYELQVASNTGTFFDKREHGSLLTFYAIASEPSVNVENLYVELQNIASEFIREPVKENELHKAMNFLDTNVAGRLQVSSGIADMVCRSTQFKDEPRLLYEIPGKYSAVTKEDIIKLATEVISPENSVRTDVVPIS